MLRHWYRGVVAVFAVGLLLPVVLAAQSQLTISTAAVVDYSAPTYELQVKGQNFGVSLPSVLWGQEPLLTVYNFTRPDAEGFQTFTVELPGQPPPGSYQLTVTRAKKGGRFDHSEHASAQFEVTIGAVGPEGPQGVQGAPGLSLYEQVSVEMGIPGELGTGSAWHVTVQCPGGKKVLGGGIRLSGNVDVLRDIRVFASHPSSPTSWLSSGIWVGQPPSPAANSVTLTGYAVCASAD